jgi:hypothetical protein
MRLRVPRYLQASTDVGGPARIEWLAALPDRVEELTVRWGLDLGEPFEPGGNWPPESFTVDVPRPSMRPRGRQGYAAG